MIIFLDIDGVLNDHTLHPKTLYCTIDKNKAERLNIILEITGAKFVVTSAWRYLVLSGSMTNEGMKNLLYSHWIDASHYVGITRKDVSEETTDRGAQITEWLSTINNTKYCVIDDGGIRNGAFDDLGLSIHPIFWTKSKVGLTDEITTNIIKYLVK